MCTAIWTRSNISTGSLKPLRRLSIADYLWLVLILFGHVLVGAFLVSKQPHSKTHRFLASPDGALLDLQDFKVELDTFCIGFLFEVSSSESRVFNFAFKL